MLKQFASAYAKLDRADHHLAELKRLLLAHTSRPDVVTGTVEYLPGAPREANLRLHVQAQPLPHLVPVVAGDVAHNLRSALDHTIWQLVILNGGTPIEPGQGGGRPTAFPIVAKKPPALDIPGGVSTAAFELVREAQPYASADWRSDLLAALQHISNTDKHREPVPGSHGVSDWITWNSAGVTPDLVPWTARVEVEKSDEYGADLRFRPRPVIGDRGGTARYHVQIEMATGGAYQPMYRALADIAWVVRQLVDNLVATTATL